jgi:hypothetical protein
MKTVKLGREYFNICDDKKRLPDYFWQKEKSLNTDIDSETDDYIRNIDEVSFIEYLFNKYSLNAPYLDFDNIAATTGKRMVKAEEFPYGYAVFSGRKYEVGTITYHIPCSGETDLLRYHTDNFYSNTPEVFIEDDCLCFELINFGNNLERIKKIQETTIDSIKTVTKPVIEAIENYNYYLKSKIKSKIDERKSKINSIVEILGVPIKKRKNLPETYEVPNFQSKKIISLKPQVTNLKGKVEYMLEETIYTDILQVIHDYGQSFERSPSKYRDKEEEDLRDHFLFVLEPRYNWTAVGEAFNKLGKTDILINFEKTTVFIAECKFWYGQQGYLNTITQLFDRYLIWRNSKAAVVIFVKNKDFSSVLREVKNVTPNHPNFVRFVDEKDETWLNYIFHINENPEREVKLAVLLFHIPPN